MMYYKAKHGKMEDEKAPFGTQLVIITKVDLDELISKAVNGNIAQKNADALNCEKRNATLPDKERFITRDEAARLLHVDLSTLWRWNKAGILRSKKVGQRRVMYKYSDVLDLLNGKAYGQKD